MMTCYSGSSLPDEAAGGRRCAEPYECPLSKGGEGEKVNKLKKKKEKKGGVCVCGAVCVPQWAVPWEPKPKSQPLRQLWGSSWVGCTGRTWEHSVPADGARWLKQLK